MDYFNIVFACIGCALTIILSAIQWHKDYIDAKDHGRKHHHVIYPLSIVLSIITVLIIINQEREQIQTKQKAQLDSTKIDSLTNYIITLQHNQLDSSEKIITNSVTIIDLQNDLSSTQKELHDQTTRLQNPIPKTFLCSFNIQFYNTELYNYALKFKNTSLVNSVFFLSPHIVDTSAEYRKMDFYMTNLLKDFDFKVWFKNKKTGEVLLAGDNVFDLNMVREPNEYEKYGTIDKFRPFVYLMVDENCRCFRLILMNARLNILYLSKNTIAIKDLEHSTLDVSLGYKNSHRKDLFIQDGLSKVEEVFSKMELLYFYMDAGLSYRVKYSDIKDSLGVYRVKDFSWKNNY